MSYQVHRLQVKEDTAREKLEQFLNKLQGEVVAVIPYATPKFLFMGGTARIDFLLIVERRA